MDHHVYVDKVFEEFNILGDLPPPARREGSLKLSVSNSRTWEELTAKWPHLAVFVTNPSNLWRLGGTGKIQVEVSHSELLLRFHPAMGVSCRRHYLCNLPDNDAPAHIKEKHGSLMRDWASGLDAYQRNRDGHHIGGRPAR